MQKIYVGSLLNAKATIDDLINYNEETILIICSGSIGRPNLEDTLVQVIYKSFEKN